MLYFVDISGDKIIAKTKFSKDDLELESNQVKISEEMYNSIGSIPCSFTESNGEITDIEYIEPVPDYPDQPTEIDILGQQLVEKDLQIIALQNDNQTLGQQVVDLDLRLLKGGL